MTYLLLDSRNIESAENARLSVGQVEKHPSNPLFAEDRPWEPRYDNLYANVIFDKEEELYKCWYSPFVIDMTCQTTTPEERKTRSMREVGKELREKGEYRREMGVCYAVSTDGLTWEKPDLDIYPWDGKRSNVLLFGPHGAGVIKDYWETDPARRYKMIARADEDEDRPLSVAFSEDGLHWGAMRPVLYDVKADTHNYALWVPELNRYVGFTRQFPDNVRAEFRSESEDFIHWSTPVEILRGASPRVQVYSMPVFPYKGVYLGLPAMYDTEADRTWTELAWSPDTMHWERIDPDTPFIPLSEDRDGYDWGCVYAAASPVVTRDAIRLYYGGSDGPHSDFRNGFFCLATLRPDGFAGYEPVESGMPAVITSAPIIWEGESISINAEAEEGEIRISVIGEGGRVVANGKASGRVVDTPVALAPYDGGGGIPPQGESVRLRFELLRAKLYSFTKAGGGDA